MPRAVTVLLTVALSLASAAGAQTGAPDPTGAASVYLLRLERGQYPKSVCMLLDANGQYHLERHTPQRVRVFEGSLDAGGLRDVIHILSADRLFNVEQKQIPNLMLKSDDDQVLLYINRPNSWQQLAFPDSASREPFRDAIDPLLEWFEALNKKKMRELSEEAGRNNCLPASKPEFAQRQKVQLPAMDASPPPVDAPLAPPTYTLLMFDTLFTGDRLHFSCVVVSSSGKYHLVKQTTGSNKRLLNAVLDGTLAPPALASLRSILDAPELVNQPEEKEKVEPILYNGSYLTEMSIPRGEKVQKIVAWRAYLIVHQVMTRSVEEHGTKLLVPLREWLKVNLNEKNAVPVTTPANPRCSPGE